jgi:ankyrin repeat protein
MDYESGFIHKSKGYIMKYSHASLIKSGLYSPEESTRLLLNLSICDELTVPIIKACASNKANLNALAEDGESALHYAVRNRRLRHLNSLVHYSGDIHTLNAKGLKAIHYAGMVNDPHFVDFFIDHDVDINDMGDSTKTALMFASFAGDEHIVSHIISLGGDIYMQDIDEHSLSCLHIAIAGDNPKVVKTLLQFDADPNITTDDDVTPLHLACIKEELESIKWLLEYGADKYAYTNIGETPWELATPKVKKRFPHLKA